MTRCGDPRTKFQIQDPKGERTQKRAPGPWENSSFNFRIGWFNRVIKGVAIGMGPSSSQLHRVNRSLLLSLAASQTSQSLYIGRGQ